MPVEFVTSALNQLPANLCLRLYRLSNDSDVNFKNKLQEMLKNVDEDIRDTILSQSQEGIKTQLESNEFALLLDEQFKTLLMNYGGFSEQRYQNHLSLFEKLPNNRAKLDWIYNNLHKTLIDAPSTNINLIREKFKENFTGAEVEELSIEADVQVIIEDNKRLKRLANIQNKTLADVLSNQDFFQQDELSEDTIQRLNRIIQKADVQDTENYINFVNKISSVLGLEQDQKAAFSHRMGVENEELLSDEIKDKINSEITNNRNLYNLDEYSLFEDEKQALKEMEQLFIRADQNEALDENDIKTLITALRNENNYEQFKEKISTVRDKFQQPDELFRRTFYDKYHTRFRDNNNALNDKALEFIAEQTEGFNYSEISTEVESRFNDIKRFHSNLTKNAEYLALNERQLKAISKHCKDLADEALLIIKGIEFQIEALKKAKRVLPQSSNKIKIDSEIERLEKDRNNLSKVKKKADELALNFNPDETELKYQRPRASSGRGVYTVRIVNAENPEDNQQTFNVDEKEQAPVTALSHSTPEHLNERWPLDKVSAEQKRIFEFKKTGTEDGAEERVIGSFTETFGHEKNGEIPVKLSISKFPSDASSEDKVDFAMRFAAQTLTDLKRTPSNKHPIYLRGSNPEVLKYIWTALMVLGDLSDKKFSQDAIVTQIPKEDFDPSAEIGRFNGRFSRYSSSSCAETVFRGHEELCSKYATMLNEFNTEKASTFQNLNQFLSGAKNTASEQYKTQLDFIKNKSTDEVDDSLDDSQNQTPPL